MAKLGNTNRKNEMNEDAIKLSIIRKVIDYYGGRWNGECLTCGEQLFYTDQSVEDIVIKNEIILKCKMVACCRVWALTITPEDRTFMRKIAEPDGDWETPKIRITDENLAVLKEFAEMIRN